MKIITKINKIITRLKILKARYKSTISISIPINSAQ